MLRFVPIALVLVFALAAPTAVAAEECSGSEWFPDLQCEREARPDGTTTATSMPYYFEDPYISTGLSVHGIWHDFPWDSVFRGGEAWVLAVQARLALTDKLAFIATKDGYTWLRPGRTSQIRADDGFFDLLAGFKYQLVNDEESGFVLTPAVRLSLPWGSHDLFSGKGEGGIVPSASAALPIGPVHAMGNFGAYQPFDTSKESTFLFYNLHLSTSALEVIVPFAELNGTTWTRSGHGRNNVTTRAFGSVPLATAQGVLNGAGLTPHRGFEGADVVNLGSPRVAGNTIVTVALGARIPITKKLSLAAYWEAPVTEREDIWEERVALNALIEF